MAAEKILEIWAKRNPEWETKYEDTIIKVFCNYGKGTTSSQLPIQNSCVQTYQQQVLSFY